MASDPRLSSRDRRTILMQLSRGRLGELTATHDLDVEDRRSTESHIDAIVRKRIFVGFGCDPEARHMIDQGIHGRKLDFANAAPDLLIGDLLKTKKADKLFTVFGAPDVRLHKEADGQVSVELAGFDLYNPIDGETTHGKGDDVAAWFVDHNYDGRTFLVCQALFPSRSTKNPWEKLQKALKGTIDEEKFEQLRTTRSLPFKAGKKVAVTVIDDRGNEVIKVMESGRAR